MKRLLLKTFIFFVAAAGVVHAFLPPDASAREKELRVYRQRVRDDYEQGQVQRKEAAAVALEQTRAEVFTPPWRRGDASFIAGSGAASGTGTSSAEPDQDLHRILWSVVMLLAIGGLTAWARYAMRNKDELE